MQSRENLHNQICNHPPQSGNAQIDQSAIEGETAREGSRSSLYHSRTTAALLEVRSRSGKFLVLHGELAGARTQDQRLKRAMLYQLSYELSPLQP